MPVARILRVVLFSLNFFLACLVAMRLFSPHFEIMLLLSIALTVSYFVYVAFFQGEFAKKRVLTWISPFYA